MTTLRALMERLVAAGVDPLDAAEIINEAAALGASAGKPAPTTRPRATVPDLFSDYPPDAFDIWYADYPHKVGRGAAEKSFEAVRKANRATFAELRAGLAAYIATKPPERSWCNPATWLNQGRWKDQPAITETADGYRNQPAGDPSAGRRRSDEKLRSFLAGSVAAAHRPRD